MNQLQSQEKFEKNAETEFQAFLSQTADLWAKNESQKQVWIEYVTNTSRSQQTTEKVLDFFKIPQQERQKVLDVGCGFGNLLMALQKYFSQVCGLDIEETCVEWSRKRADRAQVACASATEIPWSDREFNLVVSTDVFEHIPYQEQEKAASELMRLLKPGGFGYVEVPNRRQILDEHNRILFGTWLPDVVREQYARMTSKTHSYIRCWERTGRGWKSLFESQGFQVILKPRYLKGLNFLKYFLIPPNRYHIYLIKPTE
jgi:2-polyprenyl-3-methyl-5-hydroxy-6-metoxy-1,4-benzoquinol methylase